MEDIMTQLFIHTVGVSRACGGLLHALETSDVEIAVDECYSEISQYNSAPRSTQAKSSELLPLFVDEIENAILTLHEYFETYNFRNDPDDDDAEFYVVNQIEEIAELANDLESFTKKQPAYNEVHFVTVAKNLSENAAIIAARMDDLPESEYLKNAIMEVTTAWNFLESLTDEDKNFTDIEPLENIAIVVARDIFEYAQTNTLSENEIELLKDFSKSFAMKVLDLTDNSWMYCA